MHKAKVCLAAAMMASHSDPLLRDGIMLKSLTFCLLLVCCLGGPAQGQTSAGTVDAKDGIRKIRLEAFVRSDRDSAAEVQAYVDKLKQRVTGLEIQVHDVLHDRTQLSRLYELSEQFGRKAVVPSFYSCNRMYFGFGGEEMSGPPIEELFTADVYTRSTCPHCQSAKRFIKELNQTWPAVRFRIYEITTDAAARGRWQEICRGSGRVPGLPTFDFARHVIVGYQGDNLTGKELADLIEEVSGTKDVPAKPQLGETGWMLRKSRVLLGSLSTGSMTSVASMTSVTLPTLFFFSTRVGL